MKITKITKILLNGKRKAVAKPRFDQPKTPGPIPRCSEWIFITLLMINVNKIINKYFKNIGP